MSKIYRFLSEDDTSAFCHKVSDALAKGCEMVWLPPSPNGIVMCQDGGLVATS